MRQSMKTFDTSQQQLCLCSQLLYSLSQPGYSHRHEKKFFPPHYSNTVHTSNACLTYTQEPMMRYACNMNYMYRSSRERYFWCFYKQLEPGFERFRLAAWHSSHMHTMTEITDTWTLTLMDQTEHVKNREFARKRWTEILGRGPGRERNKTCQHTPASDHYAELYVLSWTFSSTCVMTPLSDTVNKKAWVFWYGALRKLLTLHPERHDTTMGLVT